MSETLNIKVKSDREQLEQVVDAVIALSEREEWPDECSYRVHLALEELVLNVMDYGYDDDSSDIEINIISNNESVTMEIVDSGKPFDPLHDAPEPDLDASVNERRIGGLGVHLVRTLMDQMHYKRENDQNRLTIVARRDSPPV